MMTNLWFHLMANGLCTHRGPEGMFPIYIRRRSGVVRLFKWGPTKRDILLFRRMGNLLRANSQIRIPRIGALPCFNSMEKESRVFSRLLSRHFVGHRRETLSSAPLQIHKALQTCGLYRLTVRGQSH